MRKRLGKMTERVIAGMLSVSLLATSLWGPCLISPTAIVQAGARGSIEHENSQVLADFDEGVEGWIGYNGYNYSGGKESPTLQGGVPAEITELAYDASGKQLEMQLDYSKDKQYGWSEAKFGTSFETGISLKGYNCITFDLVYREGVTFTPAVFASGGEHGASVLINTKGNLKDIVVNGDGTCSAKAVVLFEESESVMTQLILSIAVSNSDFVGSVYMDNLTLGNADREGETVITEQVKKTQDMADISKMPAKVSVADKEAIGSAAVLAAYLRSVESAGQVVFGQQYAITSHVRATAEENSDVKDVVGSHAGIMGLDTLSLTGSEMGATSAEEALSKAILVSKEAAGKGILVSLSSHMPNFTNRNVVKTENGYDFFACDFAESKDLSGNPAKDILPGGTYQEAYDAFLDIIAEYALALQKENIPVLFRPFHEDNGNWFWWGTGITATEYKDIYHYMVTYLRGKGVHNLLYVYSPNGPFESEEEYLERYPGDDYIDIIAMDYYDDHCDYTENLEKTFMERLSTSCKILNSIAKTHGKIAAIAESGVRVQQEDGSMEGLVLSGNPILNQSWYENVLETAVQNDMSYFLLWANFSKDNFYVPFKYSSTTGHELINEFIQFYNNKASIFANGTKFYGEASTKKVVVAGSKEDVLVPQVTPKPQAPVTPQKPVTPQVTPTPTPQVTAKPIKISVANKTIVAGKTTNMKVSGLSKANAKKVVYKTSNKKIATVTSAGVVKGKKAGKVTIKAYYKNKLVGKVNVTVKKAVPVKKIWFTKKTVTLKKGKSYQLRIKTSPIKTTDTVRYYTSSSKIATVSKTGVVKAKKAGRAVITVKSASGKKATIRIVCKK